MNEAGGKAGTARALRGLVVASIILPLLVFAGGAWLGWRGTLREATATLQNDSAVSQEQATRVLDSHMLLSGRVNDLIAGLSDEAVIAREHELHDRLLAMIAGYPQVTAVVVAGRSGQALVATSRYPADHAVNFSDREYFKALRDSHLPFYIGGIVHGRVTGADVFTFAVRIGDDPSRFDGAILVGVSPAYFRNFDHDMFHGDTDYSASLIRDDGTLLASYPDEVQSGQEPQRDGFLVDAIARMPQAGIARGRSTIDGTDRLIAYRRLAAYPVYVTVGRKWGSILREWGGLMATHLVFGIPATLALLALSYMAMRQAQRQDDTLAKLQDEVQRREVAEEALRQSQKMEAVGRLTGGIAHDFNNHADGDQRQHRAAAAPPAAEDERCARALDRCGDDRRCSAPRRSPTGCSPSRASSRSTPEPVDVERLVASMSDLLRRTLGETIAIETVLAGGLWRTQVDPNQLENAMLNLAVNARDAMPDGGKLTIETANAYLDEAYAAAARGGRPPGSMCMLAVTDTGTGMTPEVIEQGVRTVLHHQAARQGHRARPVAGLWLRQAVRRPCGDLQRARRTAPR